MDVAKRKEGKEFRSDMLNVTLEVASRLPLGAVHGMVRLEAQAYHNLCRQEWTEDTVLNKDIPIVRELKGHPEDEWDELVRQYRTGGENAERE